MELKKAKPQDGLHKDYKTASIENKPSTTMQNNENTAVRQEDVSTNIPHNPNLKKQTKKPIAYIVTNLLAYLLLTAGCFIALFVSLFSSEENIWTLCVLIFTAGLMLFYLFSVAAYCIKRSFQVSARIKTINNKYKKLTDYNKELTDKLDALEAKFKRFSEPE